MMTIELQLPAAACGHHTAAGAGLPPGFRFHPTDEELLLHYLGKRAAAAPCPAPVIAEVDIYKYNPWELPAMAVFGDESDGEWYFFSPRDRKYPNGVRPNRAAGSGYWKATGTDKPISISDGAGGTQTVLGVKKALVFYRGRPPKGTKTSWIMHEYRLANAASSSSSYTTNMKQQLASSSSSSSSSGSMRLDEWVLCRIYKKEANQQLQHYMNMMMDDDNDDEHNLQVQVQQQQAQSHRMPRPPSISDYLSDDLPPSTHHTPSLHLGFTAVNEQGSNNKRHKTMEEYYSISTAEMLHASSTTSNNKSTQINFSSISEPQPPAAAGHDQLMPSHNDHTSI